MEEAARRGHQVTGLARHPQRMAKPELLSRVAAGDGRDPETFSGAVAGADAVVITVAGGMRWSATDMPAQRRSAIEQVRCPA